jgi:cytochrome c oxidase subunit II
MSHRTLKRASCSLFGLLAGLAANAAWAVTPSRFNMPRGVTEISQDVFHLHMLILWICVVIGVIVFGVMIWSIVHHRKSRGAVAAKFHDNLQVEVAWTIVPFLILVGMAIPAAKTLVKMEDTRDADITIQVTGYQWRWRYDYIDEGFGYFSNLAQDSNEARQLRSGIDVRGVENYILEVDNPVVVPVGQRIRFLFTANDVIHAWWVPKLAVKKDAIPGFINEMWTVIDVPGTYRGQCAELCGRDHAYMPIVVEVLAEDDYAEWHALQVQRHEEEAAALAADRDWELEELMERGRGVYMSQCAACHQADGTGIPAAGFPGLTSGMSVEAERIAEHIDMVVHGSPRNPAMAAFGRSLNDLDLAAVITYERNAFGNETGDVVQPRDVAARRQR